MTAWALIIHVEGDEQFGAPIEAALRNAVAEGGIVDALDRSLMDTDFPSVVARVELQDRFATATQLSLSPDAIRTHFEGGTSYIGSDWVTTTQEAANALTDDDLSEAVAALIEMGTLNELIDEIMIKILYRAHNHARR